MENAQDIHHQTPEGFVEFFRFKAKNIVQFQRQGEKVIIKFKSLHLIYIHIPFNTLVKTVGSSVLVRKMESMRGVFSERESARFLLLPNYNSNENLRWGQTF